jgi:hypothetical protein
VLLEYASYVQSSGGSSGTNLQDDLGENVSLDYLTSLCVALRDKFVKYKFEIPVNPSFLMTPWLFL